MDETSILLSSQAKPVCLGFGLAVPTPSPCQLNVGILLANPIFSTEYSINRYQKL